MKNMSKEVLKNKFTFKFGFKFNSTFEPKSKSSVFNSSQKKCKSHYMVDFNASDSACSGIPYRNSTFGNVTSTPTDVNPTQQQTTKQKHCCDLSKLCQRI